MLAPVSTRTVPLKILSNNQKNNLIQAFIDLIYPRRCVVCRTFIRRENIQNDSAPDIFCITCFSNLKKITSPLCPFCGRPYESKADEDHVCEDCLTRPSHYTFICAPYLYEGVAMETIHRFKYQAKSFIAKAVGPLLAAYAQQQIGWMSSAIVMPIPLHPKRLRERGFNQSLLLAKHVSKAFNAKLDFLSLRRVKYTLPQTGLGENERKRNVRAAFKVVSPAMVKGKSILLVDDVATTGSTLNAAARALQKSGCNDVTCLVLARTGRFH
jgi:ComF family protein